MGKAERYFNTHVLLGLAGLRHFRPQVPSRQKELSRFSFQVPWGQAGVKSFQSPDTQGRASRFSSLGNPGTGPSQTGNFDLSRVLLKISRPPSSSPPQSTSAKVAGAAGLGEDSSLVPAADDGGPSLPTHSSCRCRIGVLPLLVRTGIGACSRVTA